MGLKDYLCCAKNKSKQMQNLTINGTTKSELLIGEQLSNLSNYLPKKNVVLITDTNVKGLYASQFPDFPIIEIGLGEDIKTLQTIDSIINQLIDLQADRHTFIVGIGGGIVCDITGFVASIYMRGIDFAFVSSTLLSQVDASVGGKNGVNFNSYKNIIGNFNQPQFVICDTQMLGTLPEKEIKCGMGEILKHALIADANMFNLISEKSQAILSLDHSIIDDLIYQNIKIKASVVDKDEKEQGERKKLNFGHTLAHAIEKHSNLSHGEAVAIGIVFASKVSHQKKYISDSELRLIIETIEQLGLPSSTQIAPEKLADAIINDKKRNGSHISLILLEKIGLAKIENVELDELKQWIYDLC